MSHLLTVTEHQVMTQLAKKLSSGEEYTITEHGIKLQKNGREQTIQVTLQQDPTRIEEYLEEFRTPRNGVELPEIEGNEKDQSKVILTKLRTKKNNKTFKYYYLLGKLLKEYPTTVKKEIRREYENDTNKSQKLINLVRKTATLFEVIGTSYLTIQKLHPSNLRKMKEETFDKLMAGVRSIAATRLDASSSLLDELLGDFTFPVSQELNADAGVMLPGFEFDLNSLIDNPEIPENPTIPE